MKKRIFLIVLLLSGSVFAWSQASYKSKSLVIELGANSTITGLYNPQDNSNYKAQETESFLFSIKCGDHVLAPSKAKYRKGFINLFFDNGTEAKISVKQSADYLTFELLKITNKEQLDAVIWGPISNTISETIGEFVGVVRNKDYALGIQGLNARTTGGVLENEQGTVWARGTAAVARDYGSSLQAFTTNSAKDRNIEIWREGGENNHKTLVKAIEEGKPEGSKIALFGTLPDNVLNTIGIIEKAEGLPHPEIDGVWIKESALRESPPPQAT